MELTSRQEVDLLLNSSFPSFLIDALPSVFVRETQDYVSYSSLSHATLPQDMRLTKYYYKPHIETLRRRFERVKELGDTYAKDWANSVIGEPNIKGKQIVPWETWELNGGLAKMNAKHAAAKKTTIGDFANSTVQLANPLPARPCFAPNFVGTSTMATTKPVVSAGPSSALSVANPTESRVRLLT